MGTTLLPGGLKLGRTGTAISKVTVYSQSINPASVASATVAEQTFTVTGLAATDVVVVNPPAFTTAIGVVGARVSAANTLAVKFVNPTAGALDEGAGTWTILAFSQ